MDVERMGRVGNAFSASGNYRLTNTWQGDHMVQTMDAVHDYMTLHTVRKDDGLDSPTMRSSITTVGMGRWIVATTRASPKPSPASTRRSSWTNRPGRPRCRMGTAGARRQKNLRLCRWSGVVQCRRDLPQYRRHRHPDPWSGDDGVRSPVARGDGLHSARVSNLGVHAGRSEQLPSRAFGRDGASDYVMMTARGRGR